VNSDLSDATTLNRIAPSTARYIKLGVGNRWFKRCVQHQRIELGHPAISHELAVAGRWGEAIEHYTQTEARTLSKANDFVREVRDFYTLGADCLWITFADGCLWWAFSDPVVTWLGGDGELHGHRSRPTIGPWRNTDILSQVLKQADLSTRLTQVAAYRQTLCNVQDKDYLIRKINGDVEPIVAEARAAEAALVTVADAMIARLHWRDFELLVDLIFAHTGWRRISDVGGTMKDIDLAVEQPATGERALVQVKSRADNGVFNDYLERFASNPTYDRMFFVCHSPAGTFDSDRRNVSVWTGVELARMTVKAGLFDWVVNRLG
jgi:hypothetical protein